MDYEFSSMKLSLAARLALAAGCFALGALMQLLFPWGLLPGFVLIVAGYFPLRLKTISNKPSDQGLEQWRPVSMAEIDKLADRLRESKTLFSKTTGTLVLKAMLALALIVAAAALWAASPPVSLLLADSLLFAVPALFFGRVRAFVPRDLSLKMPCFQAIFAEKPLADIVLTPYLRFDKDAQGRDVPEDIRLMLEPKRKPEDFVGIQMQAALNQGESETVPYLYAVALTKGRGASYSRLKRLSAKGYEIEAGGDEDYGSVVVRQNTSGKGYGTKPSDCVRLYNLALDILGSLG